MKVTTASGRKSTADCHLLVVSADRSVKAFHYRAMDTKFFPSNRVSGVPEPTFSSLLHPPPASTTSHALCLSTPQCLCSHQQPGLL